MIGASIGPTTASTPTGSRRVSDRRGRCLLIQVLTEPPALRGSAVASRSWTTGWRSAISSPPGAPGSARSGRGHSQHEAPHRRWNRLPSVGDGRVERQMIRGSGGRVEPARRRRTRAGRSGWTTARGLSAMVDRTCCPPVTASHLRQRLDRAPDARGPQIANLRSATAAARTGSHRFCPPVRTASTLGAQERAPIAVNVARPTGHGHRPR
jgi:hypothetical protein